MKHATRSAAVLSALLLAGLAACGGRTAAPAAAPSPTPSGDLPVYRYTLDATAVGPAPAVPGATSGGTVRVYDNSDYNHLDPARIYSGTEIVLSSMMSRTLTGFRQAGTDISLVGDLATDTGRTADGGKTWTYTLREGVAWEDGTPITAAEVKYGLERTFVVDYAEGPTYVQKWLVGKADFHDVYGGPYDGKSLDAIEAPDPRTLVLHFPRPQPDLPFALALPFSAPVKPSADTRGKYDQRPFASGPYKIADRQIDKSLTLVRNTAWRPESDPIRTAYPDRFEFTFGEQALLINQRLIAARGDDAAALTVQNAVSPEVLPQVLASPELRERTVSAITAGVAYAVVNTRRITDVDVRKALLYAYPRAQVRQSVGGPDTGELATTISSPTLLGHESYDLFGVPPEGDPERAKALLTQIGKVGQKIVYAYAISPRNERTSVIVAQALTRAGFEVVKKPSNDKTYFDLIGNPENEFDLYAFTWYADWPSAATVLPPLFDGRLIGNQTNTSMFDDPSVNAEIDEISAIADTAEAGRRWAALERRIMALVPVIPDTYIRNRQLHGPRLGGVFEDLVLGNVSLNGLFVRP